MSESIRKPIRMGLVGVGNWAMHGHLRVLDLLPDFKVVAVYARRREAAEAAAARFGIGHVADSISELVARDDVDVVVVLTTAPQHEEAIRAAIAAGKHVYSEWPLTISSKKAEELRALAAMAGVRHFVGLQRRFAPHNRYIRDLLAQKYIGKLRSVRMHVSMNYFQAIRGDALRWTIPPENFSGVIPIYAGHFLDMIFAAVGKPTNLQALLINQFPRVTIQETGEVFPTTTPDQLVLAASLADDAVVAVHIEGGKRNGSGVVIDITGDQGDLRITNRSAFGDVGDDYVIEGASGDNLPLEKMPVPASYDWLPPSGLPSAVLELANLYTKIALDLESGTREASSFDDAVWMHRLIESFEQSSRSGIRVKVQ